MTTTDDTALHPGGAWVPADACTLPTAEQPLRMAQFDSLFASSLRGIERAAGRPPRARLILVGDDGLPGRVGRLAGAESSCCSFFAFTVTRLGDEAAGGPGEIALAMDVAVPAGRLDVLDALLERAAAVRSAAL